MSLCHLYHKQSSSHHIPAMLEHTWTGDAVSLDIHECHEIDDYDVYIIELEEADKNISLKLKHLLQQKVNSITYFIVPLKYNLMFFQLSYLLNAKNLITHNMDTQKAIDRIKDDKKTFKKETLHKFIGQATMSTQSFMTYKNMRLSHVSDRFLKDLECETLEIFQSNILNTLDMESLLSKDDAIEQSIFLNDTIVKKYNLNSVSVTSDIKVIYAKELIHQKENALDLISSRITFVELLKEKLIQKNISNSEFHAITINIQNFEKLKKELNVFDLEEMLIDLLSFIKSAIDKKIIFAQLAINFYVILFEDLNSNEINNIANNIQTKIINYTSIQKYKPFIDIFTFNLYNLDLSEVLSAFENIKNNDLTQEQNNAIGIQHIKNSQTVVDEKSLLDDAFKYSSDIKILNIYHGLVINTPSKILNVAKDTITISFESLQGVVINIEKRTTLQSPIFLHDIEATVKKIDLNKRIVMLEKFKFLQTNANARKYSRVTTVNKTPISLLARGVNIHGVILDLSIKSIAIHAKYKPIIDTLKSSDITLTFNVPNPKAEEGYSKLTLGAKVITVIMESTHETCKIICDVDEDNMNDAILMQYIYERQKELITALKKTAQLH